MPPYKRRYSGSTTAPRKRIKTGNSVAKAGAAIKKGGGTKKRYPSTRQARRGGRGRTKYSRRPTKRGKKQPPRSSAVGSSPLSGLDASFSYARFGSGPRVYRGFKKRGKVLSFYSVLPFRSICSNGRQEVGVLPSWHARQQSTTNVGDSYREYLGSGCGVSANLVNYMQEELRRELASISFMYRDPTGWTNNEPKGIRASKFVVHRLTMRHEIKSCSQVPMHLTLYELQLRPGGPGAWKTGDPANDWVSPMKLWTDGLTSKKFGTYHEDRSLNAAEARDVPYQKPFDSPLFCRVFKVYKTTRLILAPGQTHIHTVTIRPRNMFPLYPSPDTGPGKTSETADHLHGVETMTMFVHHGSPVHEAGTSKVATSSSAFDCVTKASVEFQAFDSAAKNYHIFNMIETLQNERTVLEDQDVPVAIPAPS